MNNIQPNCFVIFGSESGVIKNFVESIHESSSIIRIFNDKVPIPKKNCLDVSDFNDLGEALKSLPPVASSRLAFVGAASLSQSALFLAEPLDKLLKIVDVNINSYIKIVHTLLPHMIKYKYGRLVYLSSFRAEHRARGSSVYSASKSFGESFFSSIGKEFGNLNIISSSIRMGFFEGKMSDVISKELMDLYLKRVALRRKGSALELSSAIWFALNNSYTNGGILELDGGISFE